MKSLNITYILDKLQNINYYDDWTVKKNGSTLTYIYQYKLVLELTFNEKFSQIQVAQSQQSIHLPIKKSYLQNIKLFISNFNHLKVEKNLPFCELFLSLINKNLLFISKYEIKQYIYNFFSGSKLEQLNYWLEDSVTLSLKENSSIAMDIRNVLYQENIQCHFQSLKTKINSSEEIEYWKWIRDLWVVTGDQKILMNQGGIHFSDYFHKGLSQKFRDHKQVIFNYFKQQRFPIEEPSIMVDGSNLLSVTNKEGKLFILISEDNVILTAAYRKEHKLQNQIVYHLLKNHYPTQENNSYINSFFPHTELNWYDVEEAKFAIAEEFNLIDNEQLVVLENPEFNLDVLLSASHHGIIFIQDHQKVSELLSAARRKEVHPDSVKILGNIIAQANKKNEMYHSTLEKIKKKLQNLQFEVVPIPAVAYQYLEQEEDDAELKIVFNALSNLIGCGKKSYFMIALRETIPELKPLIDYINLVTSKYCITTYFIGQPKEVAQVLAENNGLRSISSLGKLPRFNQLLTQIAEDSIITNENVA